MGSSLEIWRVRSWIVFKAIDMLIDADSERILIEDRVAED